MRAIACVNDLLDYKANELLGFEDYGIWSEVDLEREDFKDFE